MAAKLQRAIASFALFGLTLFWIIFWLLSWLLFEDGLMAEQGFYMSGIFGAATLVYLGIRGSIYE